MSKNPNADKLKINESFRAGYFARGGTNPNLYSSTMWEAWEICRHFNKEGLGYFTIAKSKHSSYRIEDGKMASVIYVAKGVFSIGIEDRLV